MQNLTPVFCPGQNPIRIATRFWEGSNSALHLVLREGKERVGGGLGFLQALSWPVKAIPMRGSAQAWFQVLYKTVS